MKRLLAIVGIFLLGWIAHAQSTTSQIGSVVAAAHTSCTVTTSTTQVCFATDGLWVSVNGAAYVQVQTGTPAAVVTSIAVNGGTAQTGAVSLTIPTKVVMNPVTPTGTIQ
jgi:hypothetical protein